MNKSFNILDHLPDPRDVGAAEFSAIYEFLDTQECHNDPEFSMAVCEEFKRWSQEIIDRLERAMLAQH